MQKSYGINLIQKIASKILENELTDLRGQLAAISKSQGVIEFTLDGNVITANENFLNVIEYTLPEVVGHHHSNFVAAPLRESLEYKAFWQKLGRGEFDQGQYKRIGKDGKEVWIEASYNPILDLNGKPYKVVKYATDITEQKVVFADYSGQLAAISKSQGVIEFTLEGKVITANENFLNILGYTVDEAVGQHHSKFVDPTYRESTEYKEFWQKLGRGEFDQGQYKRIGKGGREVWIEASYNPIFDLNGTPYKIVKYATDITAQKLKEADYSGQLAAISKSQGVIEFTLEGKVITANENFLNILGYSLDEAVGQHHSKFVDPTYRESTEYKEFWQKLGRGEFDQGQYKRIGKGGKEVWIEASYNPILDLNGKPCKVVKYATDITAEKLKAADYSAQIEAISKVMGVIEFDLGGNITYVNDNFAKVTGYKVSEIVGKHHSMFVESHYRNGQEYKAFWEKLRCGEPDSGQYKRVGKDGKEIWLEASYNPIMDMNGKPFKVVKYATDITERINASRELAAAVEETQWVVSAAKSGNLMERVPTAGKSGAILNLCEGVNELIDNMAEIIAQIKEAAGAINIAAVEISIGNNDLSQRTEEQASSLEETASSIEQLSSTVKQNTQSAKQANNMSQSASEVAVKGGCVVNEVVTTMSAISQSSKKIEEIISVIDSIAFQTNILALNAAVEAARAGEQGRGFAVVAAEVRNLAQRSASAAKEIKQLISNSVEKVEDGTTLVATAGETMQEVVRSIKEVTDLMGEIAEASIEQSSGIDQINSAINQIDEVTQQNAALVEQSAAATESLVEQAGELMQKIKHFRTNTELSLHVVPKFPEQKKVAGSIKPQLTAQTYICPARNIKLLKNDSVENDWKTF